MERLETGYPKHLKKKVKHLINLVDLLDLEQKSSKKLNGVERVQRSIKHKLYPFSNEHVAKYLTGINLNHKNVMVVGSSGDQALSCAFLGAREVCLIDANPLTQSFFDLKLAALKNLSYLSFLEFFDLKNEEQALNISTYNLIKKDLLI